MAAARSFDEKRARIRQLAAGPPHVASAELKKYLGDRNAYLTGEAAEAARKLELTELVQDIAAAFLRLVREPAKADPGCQVKCRLVETLLAFDAHEPDAYLAGLRHRQIEGAFPRPIDTAPGLRGLCAHALFQIRHPAALVEVAPLLLDEYPLARAEAAAALGGSGMDGAAAALHVKVLAGDREPDVLGAAYKALLRILPDRYLPLVTKALLEGEEGGIEAAALALGESRAQGAFDSLKRGWEEHRHGRAAHGILLAMALLRSDEANDFLVSLVESAPEGDAAGALGALALHRHDEALAARVESVVKSRGSRKLSGAFDERFRV